MLTPLLSAEYTILGHVSVRTDAFAFGVLLIELLVDLSPLEVRSFLSDSIDVAADLQSLIAEGSLPWPSDIGAGLATIAAECTVDKARGRSTVVSVLGRLEGMLDTWWDAILGNAAE
jgi:hypothetical protein